MLFLIALQFLTIIPISLPQVTDRMLARSMIFFPVVGLTIGGIQVLIFRCLQVGAMPLLATSMIALFLVIIPIILTGALHIEGFADMIDGFVGGHSKEEMLQIMHDSRIGASGAISVAILILMKFVLLEEVIENFSPVLVIKVLLVVCCLSRWSMVILAGISRYAKESGTGRPFTELVGKKIVSLASIVPIICSLLVFQSAIWVGILQIGIVGFIVFIISRIAKSKIGGITGDILGGVNEITEVVLLLSAAILIR